MSSRPRWINQSGLDLYTPPLPFFFHLSSLRTVCFSCSLSPSLLRTEPAGDSFVLLINDENHILHNTSKLKEIGDREKEHQGPFIPIKFLSRSNPSSALFVLSAVQTQRGPVIHFFPSQIISGSLGFLQGYNHTLLQGWKLCVCFKY